MPASTGSGELLTSMVSESIAKNIATPHGIKIKTTPRVVIIPLPPLKPRKTGQLCPIIAATPTVTCWAMPRPIS
ncbi:hypothetical protein ES703_113968 [subsurface metagenome]